jgi:hypothetical protein
MTTTTMSATNSIIIANLPAWTKDGDKQDDVDPQDEGLVVPFSSIDTLRGLIAEHGEIFHWVPVRRFPPPLRLIAVSDAYSAYSRVT